MPSYTFECQDCGKFDSVHSMTAIPASTPCPHCSKPSPKVFTLPEGVLRQFIPGTPLDDRSIHNNVQAGWNPQYGKHGGLRDLLGKEQQALERMNAKQSSERWEVQQSVKDGPSKQGERRSRRRKETAKKVILARK